MTTTQQGLYREAYEKDSCGFGLIGIATGFIAVGVGGGHLFGGLGAYVGELTFDAGGGHLRVERLGQRAHQLVEPVDGLPGAGHLTGQARGGTVPHPHIAGSTLAFAVIVAAVAERTPRRGALRNRPAAVRAGPGLLLGVACRRPGCRVGDVLVHRR